MKPRMMTLGLLVSLGAIGAIGAAGPALAENPVCGMRETVVARLKADYGETRQAIGLASEAQVLEIFASDETGSWTVTVTRPDGTTCLMAAGKHFEAIGEELLSVGDAA